MSPLLFVVLSLTGGAGAVARYLLDALLRAGLTTTDARWAGYLPWPTIVINVLGSFALGLATGLVSAAVLPAEWLHVVGAGFLGGFTTFSTAAVESVRLIRERACARALCNGLGVLVVSAAAAAAGLVLGAGTV